jgi:pullulanase-type alpha-1,6-glucosidase
MRRSVLVYLAATAALTVAAVVAAEPVTFTYDPPGGAEPSACSLRGSMNGWGEDAMTRAADGTWSITLDLEPGEYQYKFFVDGTWPGDMATERDGGPMDAQADGYADDGFGGQNAVRIVGGAGGAAKRAEVNAEPAPPLEDGFARIHYHRPDGVYAGWGLHVWEQTTESVTWDAPLPPSGRDGYGLWWDVGLAEGAERVGFIVHRGDEKDPGPDQFLDVPRDGREVWILSGREAIHSSPPDVAKLALGDLSAARAYWVDAATVAWDVRVPPGGRVELHWAGDGGLDLTETGVGGGEAVTLAPARAGLDAAVRAKFPHLARLRAFALPEEARERAPEMLRGQLAVALLDGDGKLQDATGLQIPGVLDDLFAYDGPLGVGWEGDVPTLRLWAPTASSVRLHLFDSASAAEPTAVVPMAEERGVWTARGRPDWDRRFYVFEVEVWVPATGRVEHNLVTDPYSRSLSLDSRRSQIVNLDDPGLMPEGWHGLQKPPLAAPEDIVLYELHVRDFSASAGDVPRARRGTFLAFTEDCAGTRHLRALADAGLTHVHLLPSFDIATIEENRSAWADPGDLSVFPPDSERQQARIEEIRGRDGYNWGYDPYHYGVPEGSYSTDPDGVARIVEFRRMVQALADMGLRVVMDVVYNHTNAAGQSERSVLDRIVPGYYHRLGSSGAVETSTCCQNTATEHAMMERLMLDDLEHWAVDYKVDGFRFDLMGHHMRRNLVAARDRLRALDPGRDGVDGAALYLYGEGWDFGEVAGGARGRNATQQNMAGTGIGTFNDRIRDAVRGGSPFTDRRDQGFATGLDVEPSAYGRSRPPAARSDELLRAMDRIRVGLAGNLRDYRYTGRSGLETRGGEHDGGGYTADPQETINYVSAHDNETLFDKIQLASPESADAEARLRMQMLALDIVALAQGVPFFHAGSEMLRSKSLDRDSYDSGDWFNRLDFTLETNAFGSGLPIADKNRERWSLMRPLLADPSRQPDRDAMETCAAHFRAMLSIRSGSPLFRLRTAEDVQRRVRFHNTGPDQVGGLIVMSLDDGVEPDLDPEREAIVVLFNSAPEERTFAAAGWKGRAFALHPVLAQGPEPAARTARFEVDRGEFRVPARTTAVFVDRRGGAP